MKNNITHEKSSNKYFYLDIIKVGISIVLMIVGVNVVFWIIETINSILKEPEGVLLLKQLSELINNQQLVSIIVSEKSIEFKGSGFAKWLLLIIFLLILFNVIGKTIWAIFTSMTKILLSINLKTKNAKHELLDIEENYTCNQCGTVYNPSDYRKGEIIRCENCNKVVQPVL